MFFFNFYKKNIKRFFSSMLQIDTSSLYLAVTSTHTAVGTRPFSIASPSVWNSLPDEFRDPACGSGSFEQFINAQYPPPTRRNSIAASHRRRWCVVGI